MCSHYHSPDGILFQQIPGMEGLHRPIGVTEDLWPGYVGPFIRRPPEAVSGDEAVPRHEALAGVFGMLPFWSKDDKLSRHTYNARSESVQIKPDAYSVDRDR
jgi:putative SOS response-associated peptidase YedK